ncbi:MAG: hypothetical protein ACK50J_05965 [Planctomyces sp.]
MQTIPTRELNLLHDQFNPGLRKETAHDLLALLDTPATRITFSESIDNRLLSKAVIHEQYSD